MKFLEYDDVDPIQVVNLTQQALDFALTPESVARLRQSDPRPFPELAVYAVEDDTVLGQVGIFRLPMVSTAGREDVGGIWAVSTHPQFAGRGVASKLLEEAHNRMRAAGLRFSTLGTHRYRTAYRLYQQHGYVDTDVQATALGRWETAHQPTRLRAQTVDSQAYDIVEQVFTEIAVHYHGFSWRHTPFAPLRRVDLNGIWLLRENRQIVGYALTRLDQTMLTITNLLIQPWIDAGEAVAAVAAEVKLAYVQVKISRPIEHASLKRLGFHITHPTWDSFMIKPLLSDISVEEARRKFEIGTDRFLISWLDIT